MATGTRVKICGVTRPEDAGAAAAAGADAIGIIFYPPSPRNVSDLGRAREIALAAGPFVTVTALFVNPDAGWVDQVLQKVPVGLLQFHGGESAQFCGQFARPYAKALPVKPDTDVRRAIDNYLSAVAVVLDTYSPERAGGTGESFNWDLVPEAPGKPVVLAGGLTPDNVADAVTRVKPYAVDVSGGVEATVDGRKAYGIKDSAKVAAFVRRAKLGEDA